MKVAVIGAGLAGLSAAWLLSRQHQVTLFERLPRPGFTAHSIALPGHDEALDVPLRVFYPGYYPTLARLYAALGVKSEPVSYASSFDAGAGLYFRYRNLRLRDASYALLAPQDLLLGATARRITAALLRFNRQAPRALARGELEGLSIGGYLQLARYHDDFVRLFVLPAVCTVCTCSYEQARNFPAAVVVDYLVRGVTRQSVRRACGGAAAVQQWLLAGVTQTRCDAAIEAVGRDGRSAWVQSAGQAAQHFDHVVLATQANHARRLLRTPSPAETQMLDGFYYAPVQVVTHRDPRFMPQRRRDWSPVNLRVLAAQAGPQSTIWVNAVMPTPAGAADVFQTVQPHTEPAAATVVGRAQFERPLVNASSQQALQALQTLHGENDRRVWFCGSYAQAGIPLLESAVCSAVAVAQRLGVTL